MQIQIKEAHKEMIGQEIKRKAFELIKKNVADVSAGSREISRLSIGRFPGEFAGAVSPYESLIKPSYVDPLFASSRSQNIPGLTSGVVANQFFGGDALLDTCGRSNWVNPGYC